MGPPLHPFHRAVWGSRLAGLLGMASVTVISGSHPPLLPCHLRPGHHSYGPHGRTGGLAQTSSVPHCGLSSPTTTSSGDKRGLSCQLCNVKQVSKAPPYICRLKSNSLQYKKINYPGDSRLIPLIRPAPDGKQFFFLMC